MASANLGFTTNSKGNGHLYNLISHNTKSSMRSLTLLSNLNHHHPSDQVRLASQSAHQPQKKSWLPREGKQCWWRWGYWQNDAQGISCIYQVRWEGTTGSWGGWYLRPKPYVEVRLECRKGSAEGNLHMWGALEVDKSMRIQFEGSE
jgi:hypothetical protein